MRTARKQLVSFDGGVRLDCAVARPDRYRCLTAAKFSGPRIARGAGLSYCAASFGESVVSVDHRRFNRVLGFDAQRCRVEVEAGISLGELFEFLAPKGFFLATQPGHPSITVGGCIAADVHGKNQFRDGNFSAQIETLTLFHPAHGIATLSRDIEAELFDLTCGGYGLTGDILSATLRVRPIPNLSIALKVSVIEDLMPLPDLLRRVASDNDVVYSWHDLGSFARPFGRGVLMYGGFGEESSQIDTSLVPARRARMRALMSETRGRRHPPLLTGTTAALLNLAVFRLQQTKPYRVVTLHEMLFPLAGAGSRYFDCYGRRGFHEYQALIPSARFQRFADELGRAIHRFRMPVPLASAKLFAGAQNLLRFAGEGVCFAINFPRKPESSHFMTVLDEVVLGHEGIPNIIKDSRLPGSVAQRAFPEFEGFRERLLAFDPNRLYRSELSERLGL